MTQAESAEEPAAFDGEASAAAPRDRDISVRALGDELGVPLDTAPLDLLWRQAQAVQRARAERTESRREGVTRSALLLVIGLRVPEVGAALAGAGYKHDEFALELGFAGPLPDAIESGIRVEPEAAAALRRHLVHAGAVTAVDLARALLDSASEEPPSGAFPNRLAHIGVDVPRALLLVDDVGGTFRPESFSDSVRGARGRLGSAASIPAVAIVREIQARHGEYVDGDFGSIDLAGSGGRRHTTDEWLAAVRGCYRLAEVADTSHHVIDGRLTVLALAVLDVDVLRVLDHDDFLAKLRGEVAVEPHPTFADSTRFLSDEPATADLLGREGVADALVRRIVAIAMASEIGRSDSFLVHIDAPWGAGKSSLFNFIRARLDDIPSDWRDGRPEAARFLTVDVNAWREQRVGPAWWTLLRALQRALIADAARSEPGDSGFTRLRRRLAALWLRVRDSIRSRWVPLVAALLVAVSVAGIVVPIVVSGGTPWEELSRWSAGVSFLVALFGIVIAALHYLVPSSKQSAERLEERNDDPMSEVARHFARAFSRARRPVVFLIDDLDRCDADYVVGLLEVIQTVVRDAPGRRAGARAPHPPNALTRRATRRARHEAEAALRRAGPFGFIAADGEWIRASFEQQYADFPVVAASKGQLGYHFVEKVFQLHVPLATMPPDTRTAYFRSLLPGARAPSGSASDEVRSLQEDARRARSDQDLKRLAERAQHIEDADAQRQARNIVAVESAAAHVEDALLDRLPRFADLLDPNPRSIKRLVNTYSVLRSLRTVEGLTPDPDPLVLWAIIEVRWPDLADHIRVQPDTIERFRSDGSLSAREREFVELADVRAVFTDHRWGAIDADRIRQCAGSA